QTDGIGPDGGSNWPAPPQYGSGLRSFILPFTDTPTAVHREQSAGHEAGLIAAQKDSGIGTILSSSWPLAQRLLGRQKVADAGVLHRAGGHRRVDQSRRNDVDPDAFGSITGRGQATHGQDATLGSRVGHRIKMRG